MTGPDKPKLEEAVLKTERDKLEAQRLQEIKDKEEEKAKLEAQRNREEQARERAGELSQITKAGEVHQKYFKRIEKIDENEVKADRNRLFSSKLADIRFKNRLLKEKKGEEKPEELRANLKEETAKRLRALTSDFNNEWYTIDYQGIYEMTLGLGDILLDPDIEEILVEKDGEIIRGHRGVIPAGKKHAGRVGFLDENDNYIATFSRDKFKILSNTEKSLEDYQQKMETEQKSREENQTSFEAEARQLESYMAPELSQEQILQRFGKTEISADLVEQASKSSRKGTRVLEYADLEIKNQPLAQLIRGICNDLGCREALLYATFLHESGFTGGKILGDRNLEGGSVGIGQFRPGAWSIVSKDPEFRSYINRHYPGQKFDRGENLLADITAAVILLKIIARKGHINISKPLSIADAVYLRGGYNAGKGEPYRKAYLKEGTCRYMSFAYNYQRFEKGYTEIVTQKKEAEMEQGIFEARNTPQTPKEDNGKAYDFEKSIGKMIKYRVKVKSGQDQWLLGSSIAVGMHDPENTRTGIIGMGGDSARSFLKALPRFWREIEESGVTPPKQIVLVGLQLNGLLNRALQKPGISPEKNARAEMADYIKIAHFLARKGIKNVRISTSHVWQNTDVGDYRNGHIEDVSDDIIAFNNILKTEHPEMCIDVSPVTGIAKRTDLHNFGDYKGMVRLYEKAIDKTNLS